MNRTIALLCFHLGVWGFFGFLATLFFGFTACCLNIPDVAFYLSLLSFGITGLIVGIYCVVRRLHKP